MYISRKEFQFSASHQLELNYKSPCTEIHGHNWVVVVVVRSEELNANGQIMDFSDIKKTIIEKLDHKHLNDILDFNPTPENISKYIAEKIPHCIECTVIEAPGSMSTYVKIPKMINHQGVNNVH